MLEQFLNNFYKTISFEANETFREEQFRGFFCQMQHYLK